MNQGRERGFQILTDEEELTVQQVWKLLEQGGYGTLSVTDFRKRAEEK